MTKKKKASDKKTYPCEICGKVLKSIQGYKSHLRTHPDGKAQIDPAEAGHPVEIEASPKLNVNDLVNGLKKEVAKIIVPREPKGPHEIKDVKSFVNNYRASSGKTIEDYRLKIMELEDELAALKKQQGSNSKAGSFDFEEMKAEIKAMARARAYSQQLREIYAPSNGRDNGQGDPEDKQLNRMLSKILMANALKNMGGDDISKLKTFLSFLPKQEQQSFLSQLETLNQYDTALQNRAKKLPGHQDVFQKVQGLVDSVGAQIREPILDKVGDALHQNIVQSRGATEALAGPGNAPIIQASQGPAGPGEYPELATAPESPELKNTFIDQEGPPGHTIEAAIPTGPPGDGIPLAPTESRPEASTSIIPQVRGYPGLEKSFKNEVIKNAAKS